MYGKDRLLSSPTELRVAVQRSILDVSEGFSVSNDDWLDPDIRALELSYGEKAGLQIYRNYTRSFEDNALVRFRESINSQKIDLVDLSNVVRQLGEEDIRFIPIIACAYGDDLLKRVFKEVLPAGVPGGVTEMLGGYGPLSDLSKRIRLAYAFDVLSGDLMDALDRVRSARNRISHDWDLSQFSDFHIKGRVAELFPIEDHLPDRAMDFPELSSQLDQSSIFRVRLVWLVGRLKYEAEAYHLAKKVRLSPRRALYENGGTAWLASVADICMLETRAIIRKQGGGDMRA